MVAIVGMKVAVAAVADPADEAAGTVVVAVDAVAGTPGGATVAAAAAVVVPVVAVVIVFVGIFAVVPAAVAWPVPLRGEWAHCPPVPRRVRRRLPVGVIVAPARKQRESPLEMDAAAEQLTRQQVLVSASEVAEQRWMPAMVGVRLLELG